MSGGIHLPRGRFTDALVAVVFGVAVMQLAPPVSAAMLRLAFIPAMVVGGGEWQSPLAWVSPLVSQFVLGPIVNAIFTTILLLIAGRYAEKALGGVGLLVLFVAGAYGGAIARLALTPGSILMTAGADAGLFAFVGAALMLYGVPAVIPINPRYSRPLQIAALAAFWCVIQIAFMLASGVFELSVSIINPLGGLLVGALLGRPLLAWRYRKA